MMKLNMNLEPLFNKLTAQKMQPLTGRNDTIPIEGFDNF